MDERADQDSCVLDNKLSLIQSHFASVARRLHAEGAAARSFNQGTNRGQIREAFIREFLSHNTSPLTGIGTGEIIHAGSNPSDLRNQIDVVIHNNRYPKISLAVGVDLFIGETVSSFIEIKSYLKKEHIRNAAQVAKKVKGNLKIEPQRFNPIGVVRNPRPYSFVFAYDGPKNIKTVLKWMKEVSAEGEFNLDKLKSTSGKDREFYNHLFVDGVFVLGKGYVHLDVLPFESILEALALRGDDVPTDNIWIYAEENELPFLWILINELSERFLWNNINLTEYLGVISRTVSD